MGTFSIWHWLTVLFVLSVFWVPVLAIATERSEKLLPRLKFLWWVLGIGFCAAGLDIIAETSGLASASEDGFPLVAFLLWFVILIGEFVFYRVAVQRLRDAGHGKGLAHP